MKKTIGFLFGLAALAAACIPIQANAAFVKGEVLTHILSVCLEKADAIDIVKTHAAKGYEAAQAKWEANPKCGSVPVSGGEMVGETVFTIAVERDGARKIARVIAIVDADGKSVLAYFMTTTPLKSERNL